MVRLLAVPLPGPRIKEVVLIICTFLAYFTGMRRKNTTNKKTERYTFIFNDIKLPKTTELLKRVELKIYIPVALAIVVHHEILPRKDSVSFIEYRNVTSDQIGWQAFDVTSMFKLAAALDGLISFRPKAILRELGVPFSRETGVFEQTKKNDKPVLLVYTEEDNTGLTNLLKRSQMGRAAGATLDVSGTRRRVRRSGVKKCPIIPLSWTASFVEMGWNWIISPKSVSLDYCSGDCSNSLATNFHSFLQAKFARKPQLKLPVALGLGPQVDQLPWLPPPCCVPVKFGPLTLLYFDENATMVYQTSQEAIAKQCGCR